MIIGLGLLAVICLSWTPFALLFNALLPEAQATRLGRSAIRTGFRLYVRLLTLICGCRFDFRELEELARQGKPLVVVANHPSLLDAVILVSRLPNAVCIMKASLMNNLLLGAGARMARYIVNDSPLPMIRNAIHELREGACLIIFPEGTRTSTPPVGPCASTAGILAARAGVPVQVLLIEMSSLYLGKYWPIWKPPQLPLTIRVRLGQRFDSLPKPQRFGQEIERYFRTQLETHQTLGTESKAADTQDALNG